MSDEKLITTLVLDANQFKAGIIESSNALEFFSQSAARTFQNLVTSQAMVLDSAVKMAQVLEVVAASTADVTLQTAQLTAQTVTAVATTTLAAIELGKLTAQGAAWSAMVGGELVAGTASFVYQNSALLSALGLLNPAVAGTITAFKISSIAAGDAAKAYKESVNGTGELIPQYNALDESITDFNSSLSELGSSITDPFVDGGAAAKDYLYTFSPLPAMAGYASSQLKLLTTEINYVSSSFRQAAEIGTTAAFILATGASQEAATAFHEEGIELKRLAEISAQAIAKMEAMRTTFQALSDIQKNAAQSAANGAEVAGISKLFSVEEIDAYKLALQERSAQAILNGQADESWAKQTEALFNAIERQRQGVIDGTIVDREAVDAKRQLEEATKRSADAIRDLQTELAVANGEMTKNQAKAQDFILGGGSLEQGKDYLDLLNDIEAANSQASAQKSAEEQVSRLKKEIAALQGPAAEAAEVLQELLSAGVDGSTAGEVAKLIQQEKELRKQQQDMQKDIQRSEELRKSVLKPGEKLKEQLAEIKKLQEEGLLSEEDANRLRDKAEKDSRKNKGDNKNSFAELASYGSSEAAQSIIRGITLKAKTNEGESNQVAKEQLAAQNQANNLLDAIAAKLDLQVADFN